MDDTKARRVIADHLGITCGFVVDAASLRDLGADSLDLISLTMRLEAEFDVRISDEQAGCCTTVRDVLDVLSIALGTARDEALALLARTARSFA
jgi:acyl carrier protein